MDQTIKHQVNTLLCLLSHTLNSCIQSLYLEIKTLSKIIFVLKLHNFKQVLKHAGGLCADMLSYFAAFIPK